MAYNFLRGDRDQPFLCPRPARLAPEGHLAWFVLDVVDQLDLVPFYLAHRDDGHGHPRLRPQAPARRAPLRICDRGALLPAARRSEEHTSELQSRRDLVCRLLLEKKKKNKRQILPLKKKKQKKKKKKIKN